jgi:hypothetical protein
MEDENTKVEDQGEQGGEELLKSLTPLSPQIDDDFYNPLKYKILPLELQDGSDDSSDSSSSYDSNINTQIERDKFFQRESIYRQIPIEKRSRNSIVQSSGNLKTSKKCNSVGSMKARSPERRSSSLTEVLHTLRIKGDRSD